MGIMGFMEAMGTHNFPLIAAFFIGLMTAISPCPMATNITAIAYVSKKLDKEKKTLLVGLSYTLGRMLTYILIASTIVYIGVNVQTISLFLQKYGEKALGPLLIFFGVVMLDIIKINIGKKSERIEMLKEKLSEKGYVGSFLLGVIFALAFCPFSGVLFFGMLIPLALKFSDGLLIPSVFAFATGLPVIIFSFILVYSISKLGTIMDKVQRVERWTRISVSIIFILVGIYYIVKLFL